MTPDQVPHARLRAERLRLAPLLVALGAGWGCSSEVSHLPSVSVEGLWVADRDGLPALIARPGYTLPLTTPIVARGWEIQRHDRALRWCRRDVRDGADTALALRPCECSGDPIEDCAQGTMRLHDTLAPGVPAEVTLQHDDARADWVGVLAVFPSTAGVTLGMNVVSLLTDASRRPEVADGLAGPPWTGADALGWYHQADPAD